MKTLNNLRYLLFCLIILGYFANFAQNEYGLTLISVGLLLIGFSWIGNIALMGKEMWKIKKVKWMLLLTLIFLTISATFTLLLLNGFQVYVTMIPFGIGGVCIFYPALLIQLIVVARINQRKNPSLGKLSVLQFFLFHLFFSGLLAKQLYYPGGNELIIISSLFLILIFISRIAGTIRNNPGDWRRRLFLLALYFNLTLGVAAGIVVLFHWPGLIYFTLLAILAAFVALMTWVFRDKHASNQVYFPEKVKPLMMFFSIYITFMSLIVMLTNLHILPGFYSLKDPIVLKQLQEQLPGPERDSRLKKYEDNYNKFISERKFAELENDHNNR
jgi:hypothetical protein